MTVTGVVTVTSIVTGIETVTSVVTDIETDECCDCDKSCDGY